MFLPSHSLLSLSLLSLSIFLPSPTNSQMTSSIVCDSRLSFLSNGKAPPQDPCVVLSTLFGQCTGLLGNFDLSSLDEGEGFGGYTGPTSTDPNDHVYNQCLCSVPVYNLVEACQDCQKRPAVPFSTWTQNCNASYTGQDGFPSLNFPQPIPDTTEIPSWAFMDTSGGTWEESAAYSNVSNGAPEPSSLMPTWGASPTGSGAPISTSFGHKDDGGGMDGATIGAIIGGVLGGLVLIAGVAFAVVLLRRKAREERRMSNISGSVNGSKSNGQGEKQDQLHRTASTQDEEIGAWSRGVSNWDDPEAPLPMTPTRMPHQNHNNNGSDYFSVHPPMSSPSSESGAGPFADRFATGMNSPHGHGGGGSGSPSVVGTPTFQQRRKPVPEIQDDSRDRPDVYPEYRPAQTSPSATGTAGTRPEP